MADIDPDFARLADRLIQSAHDLEVWADKIIVESYLAIAKSVVRNNPLWSGQSRLNWTAAVSRTRPPKRFVNVPRSNMSIRNNKLRGRTSGSEKDIKPDGRVALTSIVVAMAPIKQISRSYKNPIPPSRRIPRSHDVSRKKFPKPPAIWLSNSTPYIAKLWTGAWPTNPGNTMASQLRVGMAIAAGATGIKFRF